MTFEELLTEWFEDIYRANPLEIHRNEDGDIQFQDTGDDMLDAWENQFAKGEDVDLWEAFSEKSKTDILERFKKFKERKTGHIIGDRP
ncbi:MAG: hypothetical protein JWO15_3685 [Sphingomonadales bacterium]|nr:hypothetical protein [Sphingomonadales bacterium]